MKKRILGLWEFVFSVLFKSSRTSIKWFNTKKDTLGMLEWWRHDEGGGMLCMNYACMLSLGLTSLYIFVLIF